MFTKDSRTEVLAQRVLCGDLQLVRIETHYTGFHLTGVLIADSQGAR